MENPDPSSQPGAPSLTDLFHPPVTSATENTKLLGDPVASDKTASSLKQLFKPQPESFSVPVKGGEAESETSSNNKPSCIAALKGFFLQLLQPSTIIGSCVFLLYHVVFCMAQASTITRPHASSSIVGPMAKMAALGILCASPLFICLLGGQIPAIYPTSDLFLAPFLANLAVVVDDVLFEEGLGQDVEMFLATFTALTGAGILMSGGLSILASAVKLANLGAFLPYSVLCGFFSTIGILMYTLAFSVDTGKKIGEVITSGDGSLIVNSLIHHAPSLAIGIIMHLVGPHNPFYVLVLVAVTIIASYLLMLVTGTTLVEAQEMQWFWTAADLVESNSGSIGFNSWAPPAPFGLFPALINGKVHWGAFKAGLPTVLALAFLYVIRGSLHAAALKKNIPNVTREKPQEFDGSPDIQKIKSKPPATKRKSKLSLQYILAGYGKSQIMAAMSGGIAVAPAVAASMTLFKLGAETVPPQYGSVVLVAFFYLTDFQMVSYIPKPAFSCLLVLAFLDMIKTWLIQSFRKTKKKTEWAVGPMIVVLTFVFGMLNAIFIGVGISTFIFVASFYRTGVVKFLANGLTMRSTVERNSRDSDWLDQNGDFIQILVLQGYVFFGNAQSILIYITTMFEEPDIEAYGDLDFPLPPEPKYLVLDFTMVTDVDTSAVDLIKEVVKICREHSCRLLLSGLNPTIKSSLVYAGIKGGSGVSFVADLETALGRAEDDLLKKVCHVEEQDQQDAGVRRRALALSNADDGFRFALRRIDELHDVNFAKSLAELEKYTKVVELEPGEVLFKEHSEEKERGFFFIEFGILRIQQDTSFTRTIGSSTHESASSRFISAANSIGHLNARNKTMGREGALLKRSASGRGKDQEHVFRLARIGQGWVVGTIQGLSGMRNPGVHIAVTACRLHLLPYYRVQHLEKENPSLTLILLKMISHLGAKRQEKAIEQLSNFFRMLNSPAPRTNGGIDRVTLAAFQSKLA